MELVIICAVIGLIPAAIAHGKGRNFFIWWIYGALLWIVAMVHALVMSSDRKALEQRAVDQGEGKKCPACAEVVKAEAKVCRFCGADVSNVAPPPDPYAY